MPVVPDTKNWTWVIERRCDECGFDGAAFDPTTTGDAVRANAAEWQRILAGDPAVVRRRPDGSTWSPLEYACHVRDVFRIYDGRLALMLHEDEPTYPNWDQDATAVADAYDRQDPARVARELQDAATRLAAAFDAVTGDQWQRTGVRSDGARFTIDSFARYLVHDPVHHVWDVRRERG